MWSIDELKQLKQRAKEGDALAQEILKKIKLAHKNNWVCLVGERGAINVTCSNCGWIGPSTDAGSHTTMLFCPGCGRTYVNSSDLALA